MTILDFLDEENIVVDFDVVDKADFFSRAVSFIATKHCQYCQEELKRLFLEREMTMSTGIGKKIALPHIFYQGCAAQQLYLFKLSNPIEFQALDGQPVELVIMFIGPTGEDNIPYLQVLAKLSRLFKKEALVEQILKGKSSAEIIEILGKYERR